ncbi:hypothetical protein ACFLSE_06600, partial [Bacteroidota bacterium]
SEKNKVIDKQLLKFIIDSHDNITNKESFEEESWDSEEINDLKDLHVKALEMILEEALYYYNKDEF